MPETKRRYKLHKVKKSWVTIPVLFFGVVIGVMTTPNVSYAATNGTQANELASEESRTTSDTTENVQTLKKAPQGTQQPAANSDKAGEAPTPDADPTVNELNAAKQYATQQINKEVVDLYPYMVQEHLDAVASATDEAAVYKALSSAYQDEISFAEGFDVYYYDAQEAIESLDDGALKTDLTKQLDDANDLTIDAFENFLTNMEGLSKDNDPFESARQAYDAVDAQASEIAQRLEVRASSEADITNVRNEPTASNVTKADNPSLSDLDFAKKYATERVTNVVTHIGSDKQTNYINQIEAATSASEVDDALRDAYADEINYGESFQIAYARVDESLGDIKSQSREMAKSVTEQLEAINDRAVKASEDYYDAMKDSTVLDDHFIDAKKGL